MNREIRRKDRALTTEEASSLLQKGEYGILATVSDEGQPYAVPISYAVLDGAIYVHCALAGHKIDNIRQNPAVCFTVIGKTAPFYAPGNFSTTYESCIVFGKARDVSNDTEKERALFALVEKYFPEHVSEAEAYIEKFWERTAVYSISVERITGKARKADPPA
ncbi:MFS transporter [Deltaproteobacteria bacterium]|nr:MFS transporter [Deltaproteobacteria bacterium]